MNDSTLDDWTRLSAYHDGELDDDAVAELQLRLEREPALRAALIEVAEISAKLKHLRPKPDAAPNITQLRRVPRFFRAPAALAASVALAALVAGILWVDSEKPQRDALAWHAEFLSREYATPAPSALIDAAQASFGQMPDLSAAGLTLVDIREIGSAGGVYHFAGRRNCQLTVLVGADAQLGTVSGDKLAQQWDTGGLRYVAVAAGMDADRFASVTAYLERLTRQQDALGESIVAMRAATRTATRCT